MTTAPTPSFRYLAIETIRAQAERLAGSTTSLRLVPVIGAPFVVSASQSVAAGICQLDEADVEVEVERELSGRIVKGRLLRFYPLVEGDGVSLWRDWVRENDPVADGAGVEAHSSTKRR